jgi:hypothetical protein
MFGGGNADTLYSVNNITYFDLEENNFGVLNTSPDPIHKFPPKRDCFSLIRFDDLVFLMGGRATPDGRTLLDDIWCLDLSTFIWHKNSMKLSFRTAFQASAVDDVIYLNLFNFCTFSANLILIKNLIIYF